MKILIFGGTGEARDLANRLVDEGHDVTTSLAGKTLEPLLPEGFVRTGGYGDIARLRAYIREQGFGLIVDATHPFAETMSGSIVTVCEMLGLPLIRLCRPPWEKPEGAEWIAVDSAEDAYRQLPEDAVLLDTTGQKSLGFVPGAKFKRIIRLIEKPDHHASGHDTIILDRPPYTVAGETALMREHGVTHLLSKNAGGDQTRAKIDAAAALGIPVFMVRRPALPDVACAVESVDEAIAALHDLSSGVR